MNRQKKQINILKSIWWERLSPSDVQISLRLVGVDCILLCAWHCQDHEKRPPSSVSDHTGQWYMLWRNGCRGSGERATEGVEQSYFELGVCEGDFGTETSVKGKWSQMDVWESWVQVEGTVNHKGPGLPRGFEEEQGHQSDGETCKDWGLGVAGEPCMAVGPWGSRVGIDLNSPGQFWFIPVGPS